jgi:sugar lactone lactonase YvrE
VAAQSQPSRELVWPVSLEITARPFSAALDNPTELALDSNGNLYIADTDNHRIRKITGSTISTVVGNGDQFFSGDGATAIAAGLDSPNGVAVDAAGNIYIADTRNQRIRVVNSSGSISTLAGNGTKALTQAMEELPLARRSLVHEA